MNEQDHGTKEAYDEDEAYEDDEDYEEEEEDEDEDLQDLYLSVSKERERAAILMKIIASISQSIGTQAKKHPDAFVNAYKARKINAILTEVREKYKDTGYEDLLELIEEPSTTEQDGEISVNGMTYSDVEILLSHYATITEFVRTKEK